MPDTSAIPLDLRNCFFLARLIVSFLHAIPSLICGGQIEHAYIRQLLCQIFRVLTSEQEAHTRETPIKKPRKALAYVALHSHYD
jgi:hypothetical protein